MIAVDERGLAVEVVGPILDDEALVDEAVERFRDMMIIVLHHKRVSLRVIGRILGMGKTTVAERLADIPPEAYETYRDPQAALAALAPTDAGDAD